jgi:hypothetical protein
LEEHFELRGDMVAALSDVGEVTVRLLQINTPERILERLALRRLGPQ